MPNPSFDDGITNPVGWTLYFDGFGRWETFGRTNASGRCVSVSGDGIACPRRWQTAECPVPPGQPYQVRFWGKGSNIVNSGTCFAGFDVVTRDLGVLPPQWTQFGFLAVLPDNAVNPIFRFGQCQLNGQYLFDDVEVYPVAPVHNLVGGGSLGAGESFNAGKYSFTTQLNSFSANYSRCLESHTAIFATDGWDLSGSQHVTYRHEFAGMPCSSGVIEVKFKYQQGDLIIDLSGDGQNWQEAGRYSSPGTGFINGAYQLAMPTNMLPATPIQVRLRTAGHYWVTQYKLDADIPGMTEEAQGKTWFFEQHQTNSPVNLLGMEEVSGGFVLSMELLNPDATNRQFLIQARVTGSAGERQRTIQQPVAAASTNIIHLELPGAGPGQNTASIEVKDTLSGEVILNGSIETTVTWFRDSSFGYLLPGSTNSSLWWCESTYKVNRNRGLPVRTNDTVLISAARNEYEPFQLILKPEVTLGNVTVSIGDFACLNGAEVPAISSTNVEVALVDYVPVTELFDSTSELGDYPDPLPLLAAPFDAPAGINQPLWITVHVPPDANAGDYEASIDLLYDTGSLSAKVRLHVFDFALAEVTHTKTAYGVTLNDSWHHLKDLPDALDRQREVWDLYMRNFRDHRISPFLPQTLRRIDWDFDTNSQTFSYDFNDFDKAMGRYADEFNFSAFNWDEERSSGSYKLDGHLRFEPEYKELYARLMPPIMRHLREKGWMEKAYSFWFDEPLPRHYPHVIEGMELLNQVAPDLRRMLTLYPEPSFYGQAEIWSPIFTISAYNLSRERWFERRMNGEEIWWYVGSYPLNTIPNNFTEQPALNPRARAWMGEKYGVDGEIYWQTTWGYGEGFAPWNPWTNAMSHSGTGGSWGNGNGLLLYPPTKTLPENPVYDGPVNSLRWEMLREGLEDREYFWLLDQLVHRAQTALGPAHPTVLEGVAAREAALGLISSPLQYESDPLRYYAARQRLAEAIEALDDGAPMIVRDPKSQAVSAGSTITLRAEAVGWPIPVCQWEHNGTNVNGATGGSITLSNLGPANVGEWRVVASNAFGVATSRAGRIAGYWEQTPQIIYQPGSLARLAGANAAFAVTAVSVNPLSYLWAHNGIPLTGATNSTLLLTNLTLADAGDYQVMVSNISAVIDSDVARLDVLNLYSNSTLVPAGSTWRYNDQGLDLVTAWRGYGYNDSSWSNGPAQLGFGDGDENTIVSYGSDPWNKHPTTYFRHIFNLDGSAPRQLLGRLLRDDGAVVYLNGTEVHRSNMPGELASANYGTPIFYSTLALAETADSNESTWYPFGLPWFNMPSTLVQPGTNVVAVEVHQGDVESDDLSFDFQLSATWVLPPQITTQPAGMARKMGESAAFAVEALSAVPLSYQWMRDGVPLASATNASLAFFSVTPGLAGTYSVLVSNSSGSVNSASATLTVVDSPLLSGTWLPDGSGFVLHLPGNHPAVTIFTSTNLIDWAEWLSLMADTNPLAIPDPLSTNFPIRFYWPVIEE